MTTPHRPIPLRIAPEHTYVHSGLTAQDRADINRFKRLSPDEMSNAVGLAVAACYLHMGRIREQNA